MGSKTAIIDPTTGIKLSIKVNDPKINASSIPKKDLVETDQIFTNRTGEIYHMGS